jgi:SNF2 family DNA or RNA helicase
LVASDATTVNKLYTCLQQIIMNLEHFSGREGARPEGYNLLDQVLQELNTLSPTGHKLIVFAYYNMTIRGLLKHLEIYGAVGHYGQVTTAQQRRNLDRFVNDPTCRVLVAYPFAGENLQAVCSDVLFLECPVIPKLFEQGVGRVYREGQKQPVMVRIAVAENTIQVRLHDLMLAKDKLVRAVAGGWQDLRDAIYGG